MQHVKRIAGFSLLELAVVLVVISLMTGFALQAFQGKSTSDCVARTDERLGVVDRALQNFIAANARLPKPAYAGLGSNDAAFGYEAKGTQLDTAASDYGANNSAGNPSGMTKDGKVLIGSLPHATLGLPVDYAADCWGTKFTYAVSNPLTSSNTTNGYPSNLVGNITIQGYNPSTPVTLTSNASYIVVSHGADRQGGTPLTAGNVTARNCVSGGVGIKIDKENCDNDRVYYAALRNPGQNAANFFDDQVVFATNEKASQTTVVGKLYCWGRNVWGRVGNNTSGNYHTTPQAVTVPTGVTGWKSVATMEMASCAVTTAGKGYCWGRRPNGMSTDLTDYVPVAAPANVSNVASYTRVVMGDDQTDNNICFSGNASLLAKQVLACFGPARYEGFGFTNAQAAPREAMTSRASAHPLGSFHPGGTACYRSEVTAGDYRLYCSGRNDWGGIGNGTVNSTTNSPTLVTPPAGVTTFLEVSGNNPVCALGDNKEIYCWGYKNTSSTFVSTPTLLARPASVAGWNHLSGTCALSTSDQLYCWEQPNSAPPTLATFVARPSGVKYWLSFSTAGAANNSRLNCAIGNNFKVYCWGGTNSYGEIGNGTTNAAATPSLISDPGIDTVWGMVSASRYSACAITGGICGAAHGTNSAAAPDTDLCTEGNPTAVVDTGTNWSWGCGEGDAATSCRAYYPCAGVQVGDNCWYKGANGQSCTTVCATHGGYHAATQTYTGSGGLAELCADVATALGGGYATGPVDESGAWGCAIQGTTLRRGTTATTANATQGARARYCACLN